MSALRAILKKSRRRIVADLAIQRMALGLLAGAVLGLLVVIAERIFGLAIPWQVYPILCLGGAMAGMIHAFASKPPYSEIALRLDRRLHLKDRIATGEAIDQRAVVNADADFATLARRDADRLAERLDVRSASPIAITRAWGGAAAACAALAAAVLFLPHVAWGKPAATRRGSGASGTGTSPAASALQNALNWTPAASKRLTRLTTSSTI